MPRRAGRYLLSAVVVFLVPVPLKASVLVVLATPERIVFAADSRQTERGAAPVDTACKIWVSDTAVFGLVGNNVSERGFHDARLIGPGIVVHQGSIQSKYEWASSALKRQRMNAASSGSVFTLLASLEGSGPAILAAVFPIPLPANYPTPTRVSCVGNCLAALVATPEDGGRSGPLVYAALKQHPSEPVMVKLARSIVEEEASRNPETVGGPIDVAVLDRDGGRWISRKNVCRSDLTPRLLREGKHSLHP